jgi:hypothetical protein
MDIPPQNNPGRRESNWLAMLAALEEYKIAHGDCHVPYPWADNPKLAHWVKNQRLHRRLGRLSGERVAALTDLGFAWDGRDAKSAHEQELWEKMFRSLARFSRAHGHSDVPHQWPADPNLGAWARRQRMLRANGDLDADRVRRLNSLRFEWVGTDAKEFAEDRKWDATLDRLASYRKHNTGAIPAARGPQGGIARWLGRQRRAHARGLLSPRRVRKLRAAGLLAGASATRKQ